MRNAMVMVMATAMAMATGCAVEPQSQAGSEPETTVETQAATGQVSTASGPVWHYLGTESCYDFFVQPCTSQMPSPQCPTAVDGQPCPSVGMFCNRVLPGNSFFRQFDCW